MKATLRANAAFLIPYALFLLFAGILLVASTKSGVHLAFNRYHSPFFNTFFILFTYLGDGFTALIVFIMLLAVRFRHALTVGASVVLASTVTQMLKHTIFRDHVRPAEFFRNMKELYLVPGLENNLYNSYPSGHTTCAFALLFGLTLMVDNRMLKFLFFVIALLIGYSRIYLSQHFLEDVYAGSLIGTITAFFVYHFITQSRRPWLDRNLRTILQ